MLPPTLNLPVRIVQWLFHFVCIYSCGDSSGLAPDSLLSLPTPFLPCMQLNFSNNYNIKGRCFVWQSFICSRRTMTASFFICIRARFLSPNAQNKMRQKRRTMLSSHHSLYENIPLNDCIKLKKGEFIKKCS
ncbi:hypothetical protein GGR02_000813 [Anoxybacillus voinovskiensis]|uniref:Uncharacterized protein n=1 Tax=Anoxybacteroides voinovskiense TaxID=230470 RepID=A0A840DNJ1_9BACL|nr:hypothetical protein [Anoxybacillus voinovskiensis]